MQLVSDTFYSFACDADDGRNDGKVLLTAIGGTYQLTEYASPIGFALDGTARTVTIVDDEPNELTLAHSSLESLNVSNVDEQGHPLAGACFNAAYGEACDADDGASDGEITVFAFSGPFEVVESRTPDGYKQAVQPLNVTVIAGEQNEVTVANERLESGPGPTVVIVHIVDKHGNPLSDDLLGACFILATRLRIVCDADDGDKDGTVTLPAKPGNDNVVQIRASFGYMVASAQAVLVKPNISNGATFVNAPPSNEVSTPTATPPAASATPSATSDAAQPQSTAEARVTPTSIALELPSTGTIPRKKATEITGPLAFAALSILLLVLAVAHRRSSATRRKRERE